MAPPLEEQSSMEDAEEYQSGEEIIPVEQAIVLFYEKPLVVVLLSDGRRGVVVRSLCDNMGLDRVNQLRRIQRTEAISGDLVSNVRVETDGGPQKVYVLMIRSVAYWLATIDAKRVRAEIRPDVLKYQREVVDALYLWAAQTPHALSPGAEQKLLTAEGQAGQTQTRVTEQSTPYFPTPQEPEPQATDAEKATYYEMLAVWALWKASQYAQAWRSEMQTHIESLHTQLEAGKAVTDLIPEILERLGPEKISVEHQQNIRGMVQRICEVSGAEYQTVYWELAQQFRVPRYTEILESQYDAVKQWLQGRIEAASKPKRGKP